MDQEVRIITQRYEEAHGRKPRGFRLWYFALPDGMTFAFSGSYGEAKEAVRTLAERRYGNDGWSVQVCA